VKPVVVVDYGAGTTRSVCAALAHLERESVITNDPHAIREAEYVVLPGVGAARSAMERLNETGASSALRKRFREGGSTLGICLGMQLAMERSEEGGGVKGLGILEGDVTLLRDGRVPRLGWSVVEPWGEAYYFAHSYAVNSPRAVASVDGVTVAVRHKSFLGVQFHPEKSGSAGLEFLDQCLSLV
jgi:glutamine amidotransferase